ncbi:GbsR/MarR family transcriptional regulator [Flavobacterium sp. 83]|uniref:GbsR/MarR family transcriptional regulator n=1 Tax=Flavobacterium sp. 83 TaxID=1131812 RepID=UPI0005521950|nr:MarR family transcriptional regulator [Flavobacterium sp. 83]
MYNKERKELIEVFCVHFESLHNIPPLAARILGLLVVDGCKSGLTFENVVDTVGASKSSVSTNLNLLLKMELIYYFTISGDRKKYFKGAPLSERLLKYKKMLESEKVVIDKLIHYREKTISCPEEKCNLENVIAYKSHVTEVEQLLMKTIAGFKKTETNNNNNNNTNL